MFDWLQGLFGGGTALSGGLGTSPEMMAVTDNSGTSNVMGTISPMGGGGRGEGDALGQMLRGVRAPTAPETQRLGLPGYAPSPRAPTPVKSGDLIALMEILGQGNGAIKSPYTLPSTLGSALTGRR